MNKSGNVVYKTEKSLKKAVYGKGSASFNMLRPKFLPLENIDDGNDVILFENERLLVLDCPEKIERKIPVDDSEILKIDLIREEVLGKKDALILSLDTEYVEDKELKIRKILSYQISAFYNEIEKRYLFFSKTEDLLSLSEIMGFIANTYGLKGHSYPIQKKIIRDKEGCVLYKEKVYGKAFPVYVLAYNALADLSTLKDFSEFYSSLASSLDIVTIESWKTIAQRNSKYYFHFTVDFLGVQNHIPGGLIEVGKAVNLSKIELPDGWITKMDWVRKKHWEEYKAYAINDSDIVLAWYLDNYKGFKIPSTASSFGADILEYVITKDYDEKEKREALLKWRGLKVTKELTMDRYNNELHTRKVNEQGCSLLADQIHMLACRCYAGGMNQLCGQGGFYEKETTDFDLRGCYASFGAMLYDVDYEAVSPVECWNNRVLTEVDAIRYPWQMWGFGSVDFQFPEHINYPCIAISDGNEGLVFPRSGKNVDTSWPEIKAAILMGATVKANNFSIFDYKRNENFEPTSHLYEAFSEMISMRAECARKFGKKSAQALACKNANNGLYGKIAQNVKAKCTRNVIYNEMDSLGPSKVTSPPHAVYFTALPRVFLCMTMQELWVKGYICYSVTTDGFITNASLEELVKCQCYGLRELYVAISSKFNKLSEGEDYVWEAKHKQKYLLNVTTRVNQGYNDLNCGVEDGITVNAHTGYKIPTTDNEMSNAVKFTYDYLNRDEEGIKTVAFKLPNLNDLVWDKMDYVGRKCESFLKMNFDFKRKIKSGSMYEVNMCFKNENYTIVNFDTEPYENFEEYKRFKEGCRNLKTSLKTLDDYVEFHYKIENNKTHRIPKLDAQVRAAVAHLRIYHRNLVNDCVKKKGLDMIIKSFVTCIENSVKSIAERPSGYENKEYSAEWLLKVSSWKHLPERYNEDNYLGYAEYVEEALIYLCEDILKEKVEEIERE